MSTNIKYMKNRVLSSPNIKKIHNYSYYTDRLIGRGNFSTVYEAFSHATHDKIAVKIVKMSSLTFKKLEQLLDQQIQILLSLNHMNTIKCFDILKTLQQCYIFTQFCEGGTLDNLLKQRGQMSEQQAWPYIKGIFEGLKYLSQKHIIHRDLKPANIFLKGDTVKIADFGFAVQKKEYFKDMNIGSPFYMSPQAFLDNLYGSKTDVWSFGIILFELLHGKTPFNDSTDAQSLKQKIIIQIKLRDFNSNISFELRQLIMRCLEIDQSKRISIKQIEESSFMRNKILSKYYTQRPSYSYKAQTEVHRLDTSRYGNQMIIRIPSKIVIKDKIEQKITNQNIQPSSTNSEEKHIVKSHSLYVQNTKTDNSNSTAESNHQSPYFMNFKPSIHNISNYNKPKIQVKNISYDHYLKQKNTKTSNMTILK